MTTRVLVDAGLLAEGATERRSSLGRPSEPLHVVSSGWHFLGIKLTGSHLYAVVIDLSAAVVASVDEPLEARDVTAVVEQVARVVRSQQEAFPTLTAVGLTLAGTIDRAGSEAVVRESGYLGWDDVPLAKLVAERTGCATSVENDVQALTIAEYWFGAGVGLRTLAVVTVGTGVGCGLVVNGELVVGGHGLAGAVEHLLVDQSGPRCRLGHRGCAAAFLTNDAIAGSLPPTSSGDRSYASALARARAGEEAALRAFRHAGFALGSIVGVVSNLIDPQRVILTGDGLPLFSLAESSVWDGVQATYQNDPRLIDLYVQRFDFSAWARAAGVVAIRSVVSP